jgi:hypothetical protein
MRITSVGETVVTSLQARTQRKLTKLEHRTFKDDAFTEFVVESMALRVGGRQLRHTSLHSKLFLYNEREFLRSNGEDVSLQSSSSRIDEIPGSITTSFEESSVVPVATADSEPQLANRAETPEVPVKRGRGRPRKIRDDSATMASTSTSVSSFSSSEKVRQASKRGRRKKVPSADIRVPGCVPGLEERRKARRNRTRREYEAAVGAAAGIEVEQAVKLLAREEAAFPDRTHHTSRTVRAYSTLGADTTAVYLKTAAEEPLLNKQQEVCTACEFVLLVLLQGKRVDW